jgi:hypothetical protein
MYRTQVNSSNIQSIGYDTTSAILEVEFTSGDIYQYFDVPAYLYQQFLNSSSHGQFLNDNIRYNYRYQKTK